MDICHYICTFTTSVQNHWMLVICYIFYVDVVKVFGGYLKRKYLKSCIFAWGIPLVILILYYLFICFYQDVLIESRLWDVASNYFEVLLMVLPLMINLFLYFAVVITLCDCSKRKMVAETSKCRQFYIATLLFIMSDIIVLTSFIWDSTNIDLLLRAVLSKLQQIAVVLFLPFVRGNRKMWGDYFARIKKV